MHMQTKRNADKELKDRLYRMNRRLALKRDGHHCRICGATERFECHHIKPRSLGVDHSLRNLVIVCGACHHDLHRIRPKSHGMINV
jgi:5-methylcytosine-specific restriction endonuclease McrA